VTKPRLLDLFCGAGGCSAGYERAGFEVVGVDIEPQPNYPFEFHQADALTFPRDGFDVIHASPPCQAFSALKHLTTREHPRLVEPARAMLRESGLPYVIENVVGAPLLSPVMLCGSGFGLDVQRHRLFETNFPVMSPGCAHGRNAAAKFVMDGRPSRVVKVNGGGKGGAALWRSALVVVAHALGWP
jgi:DNA (cytosine-5)-methyltransferase 1